MVNHLFNVIAHVHHAVNKREGHFRTPGGICPNYFACRLGPAKEKWVDLRVFQDQPAEVGGNNVEASLVKLLGSL